MTFAQESVPQEATNTPSEQELTEQPAVEVISAPEAVTPALDLQRIQSMIDAGNSADAFSELSALFDEQAGNIEFDYLYGLAASDQQLYAQAIMAFQRVLATNSDFVGARLELAKAHFELQESAAAKAEFHQALALNPPPETRAIILKYLGILEGKKQTDEKKPWAVSASLSLGDDDNVNSATEINSYLGFDLSEKSIRAESSFFETAVSGSWNQHITDKDSFFVSGQFNSRTNADAGFADTSGTTLSAGIQHQLNKLVVNYGLIINNNNLDGASHSSMTGLMASIYEQDDDGHNNIAHLRVGAISYDNSSIQDVDQVIGGLSRIYNLAKTSLSISLIFGADAPAEQASPYGKLIIGGRIGGSVKVNEDVTISANSGVVISPYSGKFNNEDRTDTLTNLTLSANYLINKQWSVSGAFSSIQNTSDIDLYSYSRSFFYTKVTWVY